MTTTETSAPHPVEEETTSNGQDDAIRDYVRTYVLWHGRPLAARRFGVSAFPATPTGASWNEDTWAAPCPGR